MLSGKTLGFAGDVVIQLSDLSAQAINAVLRTLFLIRQASKLHFDPLEDRRGNGFFFAQGRQGSFRSFTGAISLQHTPLGGGGGGHGLAQGGLSGLPCLGGLNAVAQQQQPLGAPQIFANGPIARRLTGLTGERGKLRGQLLDHVIDAQSPLWPPLWPPLASR